jgi:S-DNA-T family DNA segregation ATPase FtsK/SpoIIIE
VRAAEGPAPAKPPVKVKAWLGEPIAISDPTAATFFRRGGRNLVIVGRDEEQAVGMLGTAILSLASQYSAAGVRFVVCDLTLAALEQPPFAESIGEAVPHEVRCIETRELAEALTELAATVGERQAGGRGGAAMYLVVAGLHRARTLRAEGGGFRRPEAPASSADHLASVLRDGPEVGVHVLAWADTVTALQATIDRRLLGEFGIRIALAMNEKDSGELVGSPAAARLREHRALLVDEEQAGGPQTFRPYVVPEGAWVESFGALLRARETAAGREP